MNFAIDTPTSVALAAFVGSFIAVTKFLIPEGPNQNNWIRLASAVVGSIVFAGAASRLPGFALVLAAIPTFVLPALAQGFTVGAGVTLGVKGCKVAADKFTSPSDQLAAFATPIAVKGAVFATGQAADSGPGAPFAASDSAPAPTPPAASATIG